MIDIGDFGRRFKDKLLTISAENQGVGRIETVRRYNTDPKYHAMVDAIVLSAIAAVREIEAGASTGIDAALQEAFDQEAQGLLG